jgi:hypothetical protein
MKWLIILFLILSSATFEPILAFDAKSMVVSPEYSKKEPPIKPASKKKKVKRAKSDKSELYLIKAAVFMSAAVAVILVSLIFQPVFIFAIIFLPAFLWFMSGILATISILLMFRRMESNTKEDNESLAAYLFLFMLSRILLLLLIFLLSDAIIALLLSILFIPGIITQIITIVRLLSTHKSKMWEKDMFNRR